MPDPIRQRVEIDDAASDELQAIARQTEELGQAQDRGTESTRRATTADQRQADVIKSKRDILSRLHQQEILLEQAVRAGTVSEQRAAQISSRRQRQIGRVSRSLAEHEDRQQEVNRRVRESVGAHRAATNASEETARASDDTALSVRSLTRAFGGLGVGLTASGGILAGLRLVRAELESIKQLQEESFEEQVTLGGAQRALTRNLVGASDDEVQQAIEGSLRVANDRGVPNEIVTQATASALSSADGDIDRALSNVDLASRFISDAPDQIPVIAGAIGDIQGALDIDDPEAALGFLLSVTGQSRITEFNRAALSVPAAIKAAGGAGFTAAESGALFSTLTTGTADQTGESSRTATIQFAGQVQEFFASRDRAEQGGGAILALQQDPELRQEFLSQLNIEQRARQTVTNLVTPETTESSIFASRQEDFGSVDDLILAAQSKISQLESGRFEQAAEIDRRLRSTTERLLAGNESAGRFGAVRNNLGNLLRASGQSALSERIAETRFSLESFGSEDEALGALIRELESRQRQIVGGETETTLGNGDDALLLDRPPSEVEADAFVALEELIFSLQNIAGTGGDTSDRVRSSFPEIIERLDNAIDHFIRISGGDLDTIGPSDRRSGPTFRRQRVEGLTNLRDSFQERLDQEPEPVSDRPTTIIQQQTVINGTQINGGLDPATGDLELPLPGREGAQ